MTDRLEKLLQEARDTARFLAVFVPAYLAFTTVAFAAYSIPSESMAPTLEVHDRVVVSKFAYGYSVQSLPLDLGDHLAPATTRLFERTPARGDVVVFRHPHERKTMIKRLIGLPGDVVQVKDGLLYVNGEAARRRDGRAITRIARGEARGAVESATVYREETSAGAHLIHEFGDDRAFDTWGPVTVPARHFLAMGDNRDNSLDGRWAGMGMVPFDNLIGRAETIFFTMPRLGDPAWAEPARARLFRPLASRAPAAR